MPPSADLPVIVRRRRKRVVLLRQHDEFLRPLPEIGIADHDAVLAGPGAALVNQARCFRRVRMTTSGTNAARRIHRTTMRSSDLTCGQAAVDVVGSPSQHLTETERISGAIETDPLLTRQQGV